MSASARVRFLASKSKREENEEDEYDSEEERYQRNQQRLLKKVEESASAIRALSKITRPFVTGAWRLEREEQRQQNESSSESVVSVPSLSKENKPHSSTSKKTSESLIEGNDNMEQLDSNRRKSIWSPIKHVKTTDVAAILAMEKTPTWKPLRKSKARQSLMNINMENACKSPAADDPSTGCKTPAECVTTPDCPVQQKQSTKVLEELRTPLRTVATLNHGFERRRSTSFTTDCNSPARRSSHAESQTNIDYAAKIEDTTRERNVSLPIPVPTDQSENSDTISSGIGQAESLSNVDKLEDSLLKTSSVNNDDDEEYHLRTPRRSFMKSFKSPVRCSPILMKAFGEEHSVIRGSIGSPDKVVNLDECKSPKDPSKVLKGVVAYVEVRRGEDDRTGGFRWKLKQLGASVSDTLNKKVTHVVFQEGLLSTFRKAKQLGAQLISSHWVMACDESFTKVDEARYPIEKLSQYELADPLQKCIKRPKIMSPDLGSGRDDKVLSRRLQRRSIKVNSPLTLAPKSQTFEMPVIKTPSPLKTKFHLKNTSVNSTPTKVSSDSDDDWDGFLAMVEAQVREKAATKRKAGEMNETATDFETRLQQLLGRGEDSDQSKKEENLPLASIFHKGKVVYQGDKTAPKIRTKKIKPSSLVDSASSNFVMMNWLQRRSPESGQPNGTRDLSSAAAAAAAAADEILQSMLKRNDLKPLQAVKEIESPKKRTITLNEQISSSNKILATATNRKTNLTKDNNQKAFVFTASKSASQPSKHPVKKNKLDFQGSAACSGAMRNWLSGVKSPPPLTKPLPEMSSNVCNTSSPNKSNNLDRKRKAGSFEVGVIVDDPSKLKLKVASLSKRHCGEESLKKTELSYRNQTIEKAGVSDLINSKSDEGLRTPTKANSCLKKSSSDLTPRRRSLRLTPNKCTSQPKSITQLETVEEDSVARFKEINSYTSSKVSSPKPSTKKTPIKCRDTPNKSSVTINSIKSQKSCG